jgi:septum formation protein
MPQASPRNPDFLIVLASSSPRRRELLQDAGHDVVVLPPDEDVECGVCSESGPAGLVAELAYRKAAAVRNLLEGKSPALPFSPSPTLILAADTVAECDGFILGKPRDEAMARHMLTQLSGREHRVLTGICLCPLDDREPLIRVAVTKLFMDKLTESQLSDYLASGQWEGKAGAFGYQDRLGWVQIVEGSESNVVGLPMELFAEMLAEISAKNAG